MLWKFFAGPKKWAAAAVALQQRLEEMQFIHNSHPEVLLFKDRGREP